MNNLAIWAIDPLDTETHPSTGTIQALREWTKRNGSEIQPVYVLESNDEEDFYSFARHRPESLGAALRALELYLIQYSFIVTRPPQVIVSLPGRKNVVERTLRYVQAEKAATVLVSSHGRSGLDRFILGSFAEALLDSSPVPVLFFDKPSHEPLSPSAANRVLFATDFSSHSREAFERFFGEAKNAKLDIVLYHTVTLPALAVAGIGIAGQIPRHYFSDEERHAQQEGQRWVNRAIAQGISAQLIVKSEGIHTTIADSIFRAATEQNASFIVMTTSRRSLASVVTGSTAREVLRQRAKPILMYGPSTSITPAQHLLARIPLI